MTTPPVTTVIERGRLRLFARAIGETDPVYFDVPAARAAGHPDLLVPPTYLFGVELEAPQPFGYLTELGVDLRRMLHGEQSFTYLLPVHAGDTVRSESTIVDAYERKGGALQFLVRDSAIRRGSALAAQLRSTVVIRCSAGVQGAA